MKFSSSSNIISLLFFATTTTLVVHTQAEVVDDPNLVGPVYDCYSKTEPPVLCGEYDSDCCGGYETSTNGEGPGGPKGGPKGLKDNNETDVSDMDVGTTTTAATTATSAGAHGRTTVAASSIIVGFVATTAAAAAIGVVADLL